MQFDRNKSINQANTLAKCFNAEDARVYAEKHTDEKWYDNFKLLYRMITDSKFTLESRVYLTIAGALAYVVMPLDVIPDFIPGIGFVDDLFVIGAVMKSVSDEVERYKIYIGKD